MAKHRYKRIRINREIAVELLLGEAWRDCEPQNLPADVELINAHFAFPDVLELLVSHPSFEELQEGEAIPILDVRYIRKHHD